MPELPEVEALAAHLRAHALGHAVRRVDLAAMNVLKTVAPAVTELRGLPVSAVGRRGKYLVLTVDGRLHLVAHLARAGWLRWSDSLAERPPKPGRGPIALRLHLDNGAGFDLTEAGTRKNLAVWLVTRPEEVPGIARLGTDALDLDRAALAELASGRTARLKTVLTEQSVIAGIGNAYSDEILHHARLSPYATPAKLSATALDRVVEAIHTVLTEAVERSVGQEAARLKGEKRSGLRVHGRTGLPCPVCGDTVREIAFAERSLQYCPTCQTGGKPLADRRLSRLIK